GRLVDRHNELAARRARPVLRPDVDRLALRDLSARGDHLTAPVRGRVVRVELRKPRQYKTLAGRDVRKDVGYCRFSYNHRKAITCDASLMINGNLINSRFGNSNTATCFICKDFIIARPYISCIAQFKVEWIDTHCL